MIRVKDVEKSLAFYQDIMGMKLLRKLEMAAAKFNLYFLGYGSEDNSTTQGLEGLLELTWNYGTENDPEFSYHNGNTEPQGFGHICVSVDDIQAACDRFEEKKVMFSFLFVPGEAQTDEKIGQLEETTDRWPDERHR